MKNLLLILATSLASRLSSARKLYQCFIGNTGCSLLFIRGKYFEKIKTDSGDDLYFNEFAQKGVTYGAICIDMKEQYRLDEAAKMLGNYLHKLKGPFFVFHFLGNEKVNDWNQNSTVCFVDYWQDAAGIDCKVKGYTNGKTMAVLYVKNITDAPVLKQEKFLDSFHF